MRKYLQLWTAFVLALLLGTGVPPQTFASSYGDINVTSAVPGTGATNLGKAEDAGHTTADTGVFMLGIRNDANADIAGTTLDYSGIAVNRHGAVKTEASPPTIATYRCASAFTTPAASLTDFWELFGSSSTVVRVRKIILSTRASTYSTTPNNKIQLLKRSSANSGGTGTAQTLIPLDSGSAAATFSAKVYTANPTLGSSLGAIGSYAVGFVTPSSTSLISNWVLFDASQPGVQPIVLRGTAEGVTINGLGATQDGTTLEYAVTAEVTESTN